MKLAERPPGETGRLQSLASLNVLDTPPEERFDRLTRMARRLFQVPISLVSLVDEDRQWFKSKVGLDVSETPRDISFCGHAILGEKIFCIPDATQDERFADNPLVTNQPGIRFYAGCPIRSLDGFKIGTLCIIDQKPRNLSGDDRECLRDLALMVELELSAVQLAMRDELTELTNRRGFMTLARKSLALCSRQGSPASLVFMDLDQFKSINDNFGHAEGDRALNTFAAELKKLGRESDIIARLSGDEFVMLLPNTTELQSELAMLRFRRGLDKNKQESKRGYDISFSHGVVGFDPNRHMIIENLLAEGDMVMYKCKNARRTLAHTLIAVS